MSDINWAFFATALMSYGLGCQILSHGQQNHGSVNPKDFGFIVLGVLAALHFRKVLPLTQRGIPIMTLDTAPLLILFGGYLLLILSPLIAKALFTPGLPDRLLRVAIAIAGYVGCFFWLQARTSWSMTTIQVISGAVAFVLLGPISAIWQQWQKWRSRRRQKRQDQESTAREQRLAQQQKNQKQAQKDAFEKLVRDLGK
ncbi:hypothetical protein [Acanthopleuribacter pedis]|uniref:Uncharacterized protein n=1 Tax=Acanthopleuribacter pedis TaxID=442870 RepID=A0A8J7Q5K4_9BACT|nr:hypothetical protein [Acanthopleuribacter pedis]MBO1318294.1 hypothetical protein [Acanthopleuribacter pedis]